MTDPMPAALAPLYAQVQRALDALPKPIDPLPWDDDDAQAIAADVLGETACELCHEHPGDCACGSEYFREHDSHDMER